MVLGLVVPILCFQILEAEKIGCVCARDCMPRGRYPENAFDELELSGWDGCCDMLDDQWIQFEFDQPTKVSAYVINTWAGECPGRWTLKAGLSALSAFTTSLSPPCVHSDSLFSHNLLTRCNYFKNDRPAHG